MNIFELSAALVLNKSAYTQGLQDAEKEAQSSGSSIGNALSNAAKIAGTAITAAATAVSALTASAVTNFADYEQLIGGVETLFKDSASIVSSYADNAYKTAGLSANEYMETVTSFSASLLQALGGDTQEAAEMADMAITDMSDNANKMGTDMTSIQNAYQGFAKSNYTMLDNLKLGYGGTTSEMERLITDAEALDSSFKATRDANGDLTLSYAEVVDAIHIVQTNMGITGTTAKEAATTISGSVNTAKSAWSNFVTSLGNNNADLTRNLDNLITSVETVLDNIVPVVETVLTNVSNVLPEFVTQAGTTLTTLIKSTAPSLLTAATELVKSLANSLPELASDLGTVVEQLVNNLLESLPELLRTLPAKIGEAVGNLLPTVMSTLTSTLANLPSLLVSTITGIFEGAVSILSGLWTGIADLFSSNMPEELLDGTIGNVETKWADKWNDGITNLKSTLANILGDTEWSTALENIKLAEELEDKIKSDYTTAKTNLEQYSFKNFEIEWQATMNTIAQYQGLLDAVTDENGNVTNVKLAQTYIDKLNEMLGAEVYTLNSVGMTMAIELASTWANNVDPTTLAKTIVGEINGMSIPTPDVIDYEVLMNLRTGYASGSLTKEQLWAEIDELELTETEKKQTYYYILLQDLSTKFANGSMTWDQVKAEIDSYDLTDKEKQDYFKYVIAENFATKLANGSMTWEQVEAEINSYDMSDEEKTKTLKYIAQTKFSKQLADGSKTWSEVIASIDQEISAGISSGKYSESEGSATRTEDIACIAYTSYAQEYLEGKTPAEMKQSIQDDLTLSDEDKALMTDVVDYIDLQIQYQNGELSEAEFDTKVAGLKSLPAEIAQMFTDNVATFQIDYDETTVDNIIQDMKDALSESYKTALMSAMVQSNIDQLTNYYNALDVTSKAQKDWADAMEDGTTSAGTFEAALLGLQGAHNDAVTATNAYAESNTLAYRQLYQFDEALQEAYGSEEAYIASMLQSDQIYQQMTADSEAYTQNVMQMTAEYLGLKGGVDQANSSFNSWWTELSNSDPTAYASYIGFVKSAMDDLSDGVIDNTDQWDSWAGQLNMSYDDFETFIRDLIDGNYEIVTDTKQTTGDLIKDYKNTFGTELPKVLDDAVVAAENAGVNIPKELQEGILSGQTNPIEAAAQIMELVNDKIEAPVNDGDAEQAGEDYAQAVADGMDNKKSTVGTKAEEVGDAMVEGTDVSEETGDNTVEAMDEIVTNVANKISDVSDAFDSIRRKAVDVLGTDSAFMTFMGQVGERIPNKIKNGISSTSSEVTSSITSNITSKVISLLGTGSSFMSGLTSIGERIPNTIRSGISTTAGNVTAAIQSIMNSITSTINGYSTSAYNAGYTIATSVYNGVKSLATWMSQAGQQAGSYLTSGLSAYNSSAYSSGYNLANSVYNGVSGLSNWMYQVGQYAGWGLGNGLGACYNYVYSCAQSLANAAKAGASITLRVQSPSKVMREIGEFAGEGLALGMEDMEGRVTDASTTLAEAAYASAAFDSSYSINERTGLTNENTSLVNAIVGGLTESLGGLGIYLDGDILVGETIKRVDSGLQKQSAVNSRNRLVTA